MLELNRIHNMDCMDGLRQMADQSVDLVLTDPPYGISYQSARRTDKEERFEVIDGDGAPFVWFLHDAFRVVKEGGTLVCFCRWDVQEDFRRAIEWAGFKVQSQIIWDRVVHGLGDLNSQFAPQHDVIWFATKGKFGFKHGRPKSVVRYSRVPADKMLHPTEKPVPLMASFIKTLTDEGGVVLDPFMGSGTTAVACKQLGRQFIGFELSIEFCKVSEKRLAQGTFAKGFESFEEVPA